MPPSLAGTAQVTWINPLPAVAAVMVGGAGGVGNFIDAVAATEFPLRLTARMDTLIT